MLIFIFFAFVVLPVSSNNPQGPHGSQVCKSIHSFRFIDVDDIQRLPSSYAEQQSTAMSSSDKTNPTGPSKSGGVLKVSTRPRCVASTSSTLAYHPSSSCLLTIPQRIRQPHRRMHLRRRALQSFQYLSRSSNRQRGIQTRRRSREYPIRREWRCRAGL